MSEVHFLVLIHGMWGNPNHLAEMARVIREKQASLREAFEVLVAQNNSEDSTYDGVDWGGERVAEEITDAIKAIEASGERKVTKFSVTGYSLGGLLGRYVIGILHQRHFFDHVRPVNFNTFATPHIGLPRYQSFFSSVAHTLGPNLLSRTGEQFFAKDNWSGTGKPIVEIMADPKRIFYQALALFPHVRIYANAVHDITVPYVSAAIEAHDPFAEYEVNGLEVELSDEYINLIRSYTVPTIPPPPPVKPSAFTKEWWTTKNSRPMLPPFLVKRFPLNVAVYMSLPLLMPMLFTFAIVRISLSARSSRARIRLLEKDASSGTTRLAYILTQLEKGMDDMVADLMDEEGSADEGTTRALAAHAHTHVSGTDTDTRTENGTAHSSLVETTTPSSRPTLPTTTTSSASSASHASAPPVSSPPASSAQPILTPLQHRIIASLNTLPQLQKEVVFFPGVRNSHATIVCRDPKRFPSHKDGEGGLKHWADNFVV